MVVQPPSRNAAGDAYAEEHDIDFTVQHITVNGTKWTYHVFFLPEINVAQQSTDFAAASNSNTGSASNIPLPHRTLGTIGDIARRSLRVTTNSQNGNGLSVLFGQRIAAAPTPGPKYEFFFKTHTKWQAVDTAIGDGGRPEQRHPLLKSRYRFDIGSLKWRNVTAYYQKAKMDQLAAGAEARYVKFEPPPAPERSALQVPSAITLGSSVEPPNTLLTSSAIGLLGKLETLIKDNATMRELLLEQNAQLIEQNSKMDNLLEKVDYIGHITRDLRRRREDERMENRKDEVMVLDDCDEGTHRDGLSPSIPPRLASNSSNISDKEEQNRLPTSPGQLDMVRFARIRSFSSASTVEEPGVKEQDALSSTGLKVLTKKLYCSSVTLPRDNSLTVSPSRDGSVSDGVGDEPRGRLKVEEAEYLSYTPPQVPADLTSQRNE